jgi:hypothetical protein
MISLRLPRQAEFRGRSVNLGRKIEPYFDWTSRSFDSKVFMLPINLMVHDKHNAGSPAGGRSIVEQQSVNTA